MKSVLIFILMAGACAAMVLANLHRQPVDAIAVAEADAPVISDAVEPADAPAAVAEKPKAEPEPPLVEASRAILGQIKGTTQRLAELQDIEPGDEPESSGVLRAKVAKGDTLSSILENADPDSARKFTDAAAKVFNLKQFRAGRPYAIFTDPATGRLHRFEYEASDKSRLIVEGSEKPQARMEDIEYITQLETCNGEIEDSLFKAVADMGEGPQIATRLVELFGSEINFLRDLQEGDKFSVLVEKKYREGEFRGYGKILAATFTNKGKTLRAWLFRDPEGELCYYNSKGENLKKTLMMAPLAVTRMTSKFTHTRRHPILGGLRPHLGVDYAAPTGTPVKAVGHGTITQRGWNGGYGNQVVVKHPGGMESMYAHLSGFAPGIKPGTRVKQGQVIGFVGSTGMSTGPHLDFRLRVNGDFINPAKAINPRGAPVDPSLMTAFKKTMTLEKAYLEGKEPPKKYSLDKIVPKQVYLPEPAHKGYKGYRRAPVYNARQLRLLRSLAAQKRMLRKDLSALTQKLKKRRRQ